VTPVPYTEREPLGVAFFDAAYDSSAAGVQAQIGARPTTAT